MMGLSGFPSAKLARLFLQFSSPYRLRYLLTCGNLLCVLDEVCEENRQPRNRIRNSRILSPGNYSSFCVYDGEVIGVHSPTGFRCQHGQIRAAALSFVRDVSTPSSATLF